MKNSYENIKGDGMKNTKGYLATLLLILVLACFTGCSDSSEEDAPGKSAAESEGLYDEGAWVPAVSSEAAAEIDLVQVVKADGTVVTKGDDGVSDDLTDYTAAEDNQLGFAITGGAYGRGTVKVSVGDTQTEAFYNEEKAMYLCDMRITSEQVYVPVLVQEIYESGKASKAKFVLSSRPGVADNQLVREGLAVKIGGEFLNGPKLKAGLSAILTKMVKEALDPDKPEKKHEVIVNNIVPDGNGGEGVINLDLTIKYDLISGNDTTIPYDVNASLVLKDTKDGERTLTLCFEDGKDIATRIIGAFNVDIAVGPLAFELNVSDLLADLTGEADEEIVKWLFVNLYGIPSRTDANAACLGAGLYLADEDDVEYTVDENGKKTATAWPEVTEYTIGAEEWNAVLDEMLPEEGDYNLSAALSEANLNQLLPRLLGAIPAIKIDDPALIGQMTMLFPKSDAYQALEISLADAFAGINFQAENPEVELSDLKIYYNENGRRMWEISTDLMLVIEHIGIETYEYEKETETGVETEIGYLLDAEITLDGDRSFSHIMWDNTEVQMNLSKLVPALVDLLPMLGMAPEGFTITPGGHIAFNLDLTEKLADAAFIEALDVHANNGFLFLNARLADFDPNALLNKGDDPQDGNEAE